MSKFRSNDFIFVPTALSAALAGAGATDKLHFNREPKVMGIQADGKRQVIELTA